MLDSLAPPIPHVHQRSLEFLDRAKVTIMNIQFVQHNQLYVNVCNCAASLQQVSPFFLNSLIIHKASPIRTSGAIAVAAPTPVYSNKADPTGNPSTGTHEDHS